MITPRIAIVGDLTADVYMPGGDVRLGGAAFNMATWAKRLGAHPTIFSAIGSDSIGKKFPKAQGIQKKRGRTSRIEIYILDTGERRYGTWDSGVLAGYHLRPKDNKVLRGMDMTVVTPYPPFVHVLDEMKDARCMINWGDLKEFRNAIDTVETYIHVADAMIFGLTPETDEKLINKIRDIAIHEKKLAIITLGKYGSIAWHEGKTYVQPAESVRVVDTTGAGDAFLVGFLVEYLKTGNVQNGLKKGSKVASKVISRLGAY